jgi:hypothetical protein
VKIQIIKGIRRKNIKILLTENEKDKEKIYSLNKQGKVDFGGPHTKQKSKLKESFKKKLKK